MGRIKTTLIKRKTQDIIKSHGEKASDEFEANKKLVVDVTTVRTKKLRNAIAGYLTRLVKKSNDM